MKIKKTKKMRLDELLKNVWDGNLPAKTYPSDCRTETVKVRDYGVDFRELRFGDVHKNTTYTAEVEEELTEDTEFNQLWESYWDSEDSIMRIRSIISPIRRGDDVVSINGIKSTNVDLNKAVAIFYKDTLIWSAESGIPESGVLEVEQR